VYSANGVPLKVKTDKGKHLFTFDPATRTIEIVERGQTFFIPMWLVDEHLRTSQRDTITVYSEPEEKIPCGHTHGTVLNAYMDRVCADCGK